MGGKMKPDAEVRGWSGVGGAEDDADAEAEAGTGALTDADADDVVADDTEEVALVFGIMVGGSGGCGGALLWLLEPKPEPEGVK